MTAIVKINDDMWEEVNTHLLPKGAKTEEAGFAFATHKAANNSLIIEIVEWMPLCNSDFSKQYGDYLELTSETRSRIIKHAHVSGTSLVEFHSHPFPYPAAFSYADKVGLQEFVPHVMWRLPNRPYTAIVVAPSGFDSLVWTDSKSSPSSIKHVVTESQNFSPTNISINSWSNHE